MRALILFTLSLSISTLTSAKILVLEYDDGKSEIDHAALVRDVACPEREEDCDIARFERFDDETFTNFLEEITGAYSVINMSFTMFPTEAPSLPQFHPRFDEVRRETDELNRMMRAGAKVLDEYIVERPETLFTVASGNGKLLAGMFPSGGLEINEDNPFFPAQTVANNKVTVSSATLTSVSSEHELVYDREEYANFGIKHVDVLAAVPLAKSGEKFDGTSFAAPNVGKLATEILNDFPTLNAFQLKQVFLHSCHVKNLARAVELSEDQLRNGEESRLSKALSIRNRFDRAEAVRELDIILVRCGGVLVPEMAKACASHFSAGIGTIKDSCLQAHIEYLNASNDEVELLKQLWNLRDI